MLLLAPMRLSISSWTTESRGHALVLFDVNRSAQASHMLKGDPGPLTNRLLSSTTLPFELTVVANRGASIDEPVDALVRAPAPPWCAHHSA